jgi:hypothetical protein
VSTDQIAIVIVTGRLSGLTSKALGRATVIKAKVSLIGLVTVLSVALTGCAGGGNQDVAPTQTPTATPTPTPTVTVPALTPEEAWDSFNQISDASCQASYGGLVEEEISGPNVGKLKIRLTFEQAGENSLVASLPNGEVSVIDWSQLLACESKVFIYSMETEGYSYESNPGYSVDWPIQITFDPQTSKFTTSRNDLGEQRTLVFEVLDGKFSIVEEVEAGSKTKLTYGLPGAAETQIVNDYFESLYGGN